MFKMFFSVNVRKDGKHAVALLDGVGLAEHEPWGVFEPDVLGDVLLEIRAVFLQPRHQVRMAFLGREEGDVDDAGTQVARGACFDERYLHGVDAFALPDMVERRPHLSADDFVDALNSVDCHDD